MNKSVRWWKMERRFCSNTLYGVKHLFREATKPCSPYFSSTLNTIELHFLRNGTPYEGFKSRISNLYQTVFSAFQLRHVIQLYLYSDPTKLFLTTSNKYVSNIVKNKHNNLEPDAIQAILIRDQTEFSPATNNKHISGLVKIKSNSQEPDVIQKSLLTDQTKFLLTTRKECVSNVLQINFAPDINVTKGYGNFLLHQKYPTKLCGRNIFYNNLFSEPRFRYNCNHNFKRLFSISTENFKISSIQTNSRRARKPTAAIIFFETLFSDPAVRGKVVEYAVIAQIKQDESITIPLNGKKVRFKKVRPLLGLKLSKRTFCQESGIYIPKEDKFECIDLIAVNKKCVVGISIHTSAGKNVRKDVEKFFNAATASGQSFGSKEIHFVYLCPDKITRDKLQKKWEKMNFPEKNNYSNKVHFVCFEEVPELQGLVAPTYYSILNFLLNCTLQYVMNSNQ